MNSFLSSKVIANLPEWFAAPFLGNARLCLPYAPSIRDLDDIIRAVRADRFRFYLEADGGRLTDWRIVSSLDVMRSVHEVVFYNAPSEAVLLFEDRNLWLYFDGDQRFSTIVSSEELIRKAFPNSREAMKWYFVQQTDDISLDDSSKVRLFDEITTI